MAQQILVKTPTSEYPIYIDAGSVAQIGEHVERFGLEGRCVVVTNQDLAHLYGDALVRALPNAVLLTVPDGEQYKTLETVASLYTQMIAAGIDRSSTLVALGGGVIGDSAGFAAATYMRGIRFVQIPTSLLAMVDSSVGGKVGVDLPQGKNLVGAFKQPDFVLIDPDVLKTLPANQWRCGMAETIKHGLLADESLLDAALWSPNRAGELVARAVKVKVDVVEADPYEHHIRAHLNLGHTFAHAVEQVTGYAWLHGEAVGFGLVAAARLSARLGLCDRQLADQVEMIVSEIGLPTHLGDLDVEQIYAAMGTDKKWQSGHSRFVLLEGMCQPVVVENIAKAQVLAVLEGLR